MYIYNCRTLLLLATILLANHTFVRVKYKKTTAMVVRIFLYWVDIVFQLVHQSWCVALKNTCRYMAERCAVAANIISQRTTTQQQRRSFGPPARRSLPRARATLFKSKERTLRALTLIHTLLSDMCAHHGAVTPTHTQC